MDFACATKQSGSKLSHWKSVWTFPTLDVVAVWQLFAHGKACSSDPRMETEEHHSGAECKAHGLAFPPIFSRGIPTMVDV